MLKKVQIESYVGENKIHSLPIGEYFHDINRTWSDIQLILFFLAGVILGELRAFEAPLLCGCIKQCWDLILFFRM